MFKDPCDLNTTMQIFEVSQPKLNISTAQSSKVKLYRGIGNMYDDPIGTKKIQAIRTDRQLLHSTQLAGHVFDLLMQTLKLPVRKENTASVTRSQEQAMFYGPVCRVYPVDGTLFVYCTKVSDMLGISTRIMTNVYSGLQTVREMPPLHDENDQELLTDILTPYAAMIDQYVTKAAAKIAKDVDLRSTNNIDELRAAPGEILMYGKPYFLAVKVSEDQ